MRGDVSFFGISQSQLAVDYVAHFTKDRESASRLLNKFSLTVFKTNMNGLLFNGDGGVFDKRMKFFAKVRDNNAVQAIDKEEEDIVQINTPLSGVTDIVRQSLEMMAVIFRMPAVKLLGISPAGLNATGQSDMDNWHEYVLSQENKIFKAPLKKALDVLQMNAFGDIDKTIGFNFNELGRRDEVSQANINKIKADTDAVYVGMGALSNEEVRERLAKDPVSGYDNIEVSKMPEPDLGEMEMGAGFDKEFDPFAADEWEEGSHPRREDGKFGNGSGNKGGDPFGKAYTEYSGKPGEAIDKLLKEKSGHVPGAIHKEGIGDIDFVYGEAGEKGSGSGYGLAHIVRRRNEEGNDGEAFVKELPKIIKDGKAIKRDDNPGRMYIVEGSKEAAVRLTWDDKERNWLVSAYIVKEK